ncbi:MAG: AbrB/MazE/SpoVT family DNA-binding domain-containing protein [Micromonosporaceae bacterium]
MRITSKGQVTIPVEIRERAGLLPNTEVEFEYDGNTVKIVKVTEPRKETRGERLVRLAWGSAPPGGLSTDEIMALTRGEE